MINDQGRRARENWVRGLAVVAALVMGLGAGAGWAQETVAPYAEHPEAQAFIARMSDKHGFAREALVDLFNRVERQDSIIRAMNRPAEAKPWHEYRKLFLTERRIAGGIEFYRAHRALIDRVEQAYGVPGEYLVAIVGVETNYGGYIGSFGVLEAVSTLAFDYPRRASFFTRELEQLLLLQREEGIDLVAAKGSYAGAMGMPQFIASSYRAYAVDFDGDGRRDLWSSLEDILGSVANYFAAHGWESGAPVVSRALVRGNLYDRLLDQGLKPKHRLAYVNRFDVVAEAPLSQATEVALFGLDEVDGKSYWLGLNNFYVITRYNRSPLYAMAVHELAGAIRAGLDAPS